MNIGLFCINLTGDGNDSVVSDDMMDRIGNGDLTGSDTAEGEAVRVGAIVRTVLLLTTGRELKMGLAPAAAPE